MMKTTTGLLLAAMLLLAACAGPKGPAGPPTAKPGEFELSGSVECVAGVATIHLSWTAATGASSYVVLQDDEAESGELTVREFEPAGEFIAGSELGFVVRAGNA